MLVQLVDKMTLNLQVTHRKLSLGSRDSVTGWYAKSFTEQARNIEMLIIPRSSASLARLAGTYVRLDALGLTCDGVKEGDEIKTDANVYYEVKATREYFISNSFSHREVDLVQLPLHEDLL